MSEQWYWRHGHELRGPLDTESLEQLIARHRVGDRDQVRLAGDETWLDGAEVKALFSDREHTVSSSEAAARLLSQARKLHAEEPRRSDRAGGRIRHLLAQARRAMRLVGGPIERLGDACEAGLRFGTRRAKLLLGLAAAGLAIVAAINLHFDSNARHRRVYAHLEQTWQSLAVLQARKPAESELRVFADAQLPGIRHDLDALVRDAAAAPGRSGDSFSWLHSGERNWNVAHTRNALIQAALAMQSILNRPLEPAAPSATVEVFQQHMSNARQRLTEATPTSAVTFSPRQADGPHRSWPPLFVAAVVVMDLVLAAALLRYWRRTRS